MWQLKKGFTLFELMMVILIIGASYALLTPSFKVKKQEGYSFNELKKYMFSFEGKGKRTLICLDDCKKCYVYVDDKRYDSNFIKKELEVYKYMDGYLDKKEFFDPKRVDVYDEICLKYTYDTATKIGDELIVRYGEKAYYFPPFFEESIIFDSIDELSEYLTRHLKDLKD